MKRIPLTQGQFALVDDEDFEWLNQWKWQARWNKHTRSYYAIRSKIFADKRKTVYMGRTIMKTPENLICDHIDHDTLNHQKHNLRNVTKSQNQMNRKKFQKNNDLGILGISKIWNGFRAVININGKQIHFPTRKTIKEAIADRQVAEETYYGKYRKK